MYREQIGQDLKDLQILARRLASNLDHISTEELARLVQDLSPLLEKVRQAPTGGIPEPGSESLEEQLRRLTRENQRQRALLDAIFDADPGGLAVVSGPELRFAYANPAYRYICPRLGADLNDLRYQEVWANGNDGFYEEVRRVLESGRPFQALNYKRDYPDGSVRYFTFQARRIEWENELAALVILWDTTELEESEQAARESESYFRQLVNLSPDAIFVQADGQFAFLNQAALELFGAERPEQLLGRQVLDQIHPDFVESVKERIRQLNVERKAVPPVAEALLRLDGSRVDVEAVAAPYVMNNRIGAMVIARDITARIESEKALRASIQRERARSAELTAIMDATPAYLWITHDAQARDITGNRAAHEILRMRPGDNLSKSGPEPERLRHFIVMRDGREIPPADLPVQMAAAGTSIRDYEFEMVLEDGEVRYLVGNASPLFDEQGSPAGAVSAFIDITDRKLAEQQAAEEREWFRVTLASIGDAVITTDTHSRVTFLNPVAEQLTGWTVTEAAGQPLERVFSIINEQSRQPAQNPVEKVLREGRVIGLANHTALISRSGQIIPIEDSAAPIMDSQRRVRGVVMVFHDVTEERKVEQALQESEARFRLLADNIPQLAWMADAQGGRYWFNQRWYDYSGTTLEEMRGWGWQKIHHPDYADQVVDRMRRAFAAGEPWEDTFPLRRKDGQHRWFLTRALPQRDANGRVVRWFGTNTDITEQKLAEQRIAEEQEWFHTTLSSIGDAVITTDKEGNVTFINPVAEALTGWSRVDAAGQPMSQVFFIINEQTRKPAPSPVERVLREGNVVGLANHTALISRDGRVIPIEDSAAPIKDPAGKTLGVVMVFHEVTEKRRSENALKEREKELNKLNRTLSAMSKSNQAMMRAEDESQFMQQVCQIITQDCGYIMVWIGFAEQDENKTVRPVASAGHEDGYLDLLKITWADTERGRGPTGTAIRDGKPVICANMLTDPTFRPWRSEAARRGYASSLVLPLLDGDHAYGSITIYSTELNPFSADEVKLLSELASDLSYGITAFRLRAEHARAEAAVRASEAHLRESESRYRSLFEGMTEGFALHEIICNEQGRPSDYRFLEVNPAFEKLTGLTQAEVKDKAKSQVEKLQGDDPKWIEIYGRVALTGEPVHFENYSPALQRYYEVYAFRPAPLQFAVLFMDVTQRRQAEEALLQAQQEALRSQSQIEVQRRLIEQREQERQQIARDLHDGPVQELTAASFALQALATSIQDPQVEGDLNSLRDSLQEAIQELRQYAQELRPPVLFNFGLRRAIESYLETFEEKHPDLTIHLEVNWAGQLLPEQMATALFRIFQECLNNIVKHAHASEVWIRLDRNDNQVHMEVADNGAGFTAPHDLLALARQGHLGLVGIRERAEAVNGRVEIKSAPGQGSQIIVHVPFN